MGKREDYTKYNKLCGLVTKLVAQLRKLPQSDEDRIKMTEVLLDKLYQMGLVPHKQDLETCNKLAASAFCRRRLPIVMVQMKFCQTPGQAVQYIKDGHIR